MATTHTQLDLFRVDTNITIQLIGPGEGAYRLAYPTFAPPIAPVDTTLLRTYPTRNLVWDLTINIHGSSITDLYSKLNDLIEFFNRPLNDVQLPVIVNSGVVVRFSPKGTTSTGYAYFRKLLSMQLPTEYTDAADTLVLRGFRVQFETSGYSVGAGDTSGAGFFTPLDTVASWFDFPFGGVNLPTPCDVTITSDNTNHITYPTTPNLHYLITTPGPSFISPTTNAGIYVSNNILVNTDITSVADAGNNAPHNVGRFTPSQANVWRLAGFKPADFRPSSPNTRLYAYVRANNNSGFRARVRILAGGGSAGNNDIIAYTSPVSIPFNNGYPQLVYLGNFNPGYVQSQVPAFEPLLEVAANVASGTLDILKFIIVADYFETGLFVYQPISPYQLGSTTAIRTAINERGGTPHVGYYSFGGGSLIGTIPYYSSPFIYRIAQRMNYYLLPPWGTKWRPDAPSSGIVNFNVQFLTRAYKLIPGVTL